MGGQLTTRRVLIVVDPTVEEGRYEVGGTLWLPGDTPLDLIGFAATARICKVQKHSYAEELADEMENQRIETLIWEAP